MKVPDFITNSTGNDTSGKRKMVALSELNVTRDLFDFNFLKKSDEPAEDLTYSLAMTGWDEDYINIKVNFTDPKYVSQGL